MNSSIKKMLVLLVVIVVYFFVSYDVVDLPCKEDVSVSEFNTAWSYASSDPNWSKRTESTFHSKLFGDIKIYHSNVRTTKDIVGGMRRTDVISDLPVDDKRWIINMINWFKCLLIILLGVVIFFTTESNDSSSLLLMIYSLIHGFASLWYTELSYGFSEIVIVILFLLNCSLPQKKY